MFIGKGDGSGRGGQWWRRLTATCHPPDNNVLMGSYLLTFQIMCFIQIGINVTLSVLCFLKIRNFKILTILCY